MKNCNILRKFTKGVLIIIFIVLIIMSPVFINYILSIKKPNDIIIVDNSDWIGFWGSIIGGIITFASLLITLIFQRKREEKNNRMQVYPFMRYVFNNYEIGHEFREGTPYYLLHDSKSTQSECKLDVIGGLTIKNIGLNSAIEVNILEVQSFGSMDITRHEFDAIEVNEEIEIEFDILMPRDCLNNEHYIPFKIEILIGYSDLLGYYYEQKIILKIMSSSILTNISGKCITERKFEIKIDSVEQSLVFENKDIKKEKLKRQNNFLNQNRIKYKLKKIRDKFKMRASQ